MGFGNLNWGAESKKIKSRKSTTYGEYLPWTEKKDLYTALKEASKADPVIFHKRKECENPTYEYEWDKTLRRREEEHPLMEGGNYKKQPLFNQPILGSSGVGTVKRHKPKI